MAVQPTEPVRFQLFDAVAAHVGDRRVDMGSPRERCLLAALLLNNGQQVRRFDLTNWIWDAEPRNPFGELDRFMTNLHKRLTEIGLTGALINKDGLCRLEVPEASVDVHRFRALVARARGADDIRAAGLLAEALELSRGVPLAGVRNIRIDGVRQTIEAERHGAEVAFLRIELRLGRHEERIADIARLFDERPDDSAMVELAMHAYYQAGRQSAVVNVYKRHRDCLDESGLSPAPSVETLYTSILNHDESLLPESATRIPNAANDSDPAVVPVPVTELARARDRPAPPADAHEVLETQHVLVLVGEQNECRDTALRLLGDRSQDDGLIVVDVLKKWLRPSVAEIPVPRDSCGYLLTLNDLTSDRAGTAFAEDLVTHAGRLADRGSYLVVTVRPELWRDCWHTAGHLTVRLARPADSELPEREHLVLTDPDGTDSAYPLRDGFAPRRLVSLGRAVSGDPDPDIVLDTGNSGLVSRRHALLSYDDGEWWLEPKSKNKTSIRRRGESRAEHVDDRVRLQDGDVILVEVRAVEVGRWRGWQIEFRDPQATTTSRGDDK